MATTPDWTFQLLWFSAGIGGTGAVWYFLSQREPHSALWAGFATAVLVCFTIALHIRNDLLMREQAVSSGPHPKLSATSSVQVADVPGSPRPVDAPVGSVEPGSKWVVDTPLNDSRVWHATVANDAHVYVCGGFNRLSGRETDVRYRTTEWTTVVPDGTFGPWQSGPQMTKIRIGASAVIIRNWIYLLGGETGEIGQACDRPETCFTASIERAAIHGDGSLGPWELIGTMQSERWGFAAIVVGSSLYIIGGNDGKKPLASVERMRLSPNGNIGDSEPVAGLKVPRWALAAVHSAGSLYVFGGYDGENTLRTIERARVNDDGSLGTWEIVGTMLDRRQGAAAVIGENRVYVVGGYSGSGPGDTPGNEYLRSVETATFNEGSLGQFERASPLRSRRGYHGAVKIGHRLYAIGGGDGTRFVATVERLDVR